jgi:hypothetical protein
MGAQAHLISDEKQIKEKKQGDGQHHGVNKERAAPSKKASRERVLLQSIACKVDGL